MSMNPYKQDVEQTISSLANDDIPIVSDTSLIISITQRLSALEKQMKNLRKITKEKDNQICILANCKNDLESIVYQHNNENTMQILNKLEQVQIENEGCKRQIAEMELFLADYGMEWVGYKHDNETIDDTIYYHHEIKKEDVKKSTNSNKNCVYFNIDIMMQKIKELNSVVNYQHITKNKHSNIHHFTSAPTISLIFYLNGIFIKNGPLRKYELCETKQFIRDILDGYFPSELKNQYPNGVIFEAVNCTNKYCPLNHIASVDAKYTGDNMTAEQLISQLPQTIIRNGKIVNYRSEFQCKNNNDVIFIDTPVARLLQSEQCLLTKNNKLNDIKISTLRIKSSNHNITLVLKMNVNDTLAMVYELVHKYLQIRKQNTEQYKDNTVYYVPYAPYEFELFCAFPKKIYNDLKQTLQDAKLVPNATLFLRYTK
eukprot:428830_1